MNKIYEAPIMADSAGELFLVFPDDLVDAMDWSEGETLKWQQNDNGSWTLTKNENSNTK